MPSVVFGGFIVAHGLITALIGLTTVTRPDAPSLSLPSWFSWWPGPFGRSWLIDLVGLGTGVGVLGGLAWLLAGVALVGAGLGWLGFGGLASHTQPLAVAGAGVGLVALAVYFHPLYLVAVVINVAILVGQLRIAERAA